MRTLGMRRAADAEEAALDPHLRGPLERFCAGVNAAAATPRRSPSRCSCCAARVRALAPADVLALGKLLAFGLSTNWERELLRADMVRALGPELAARSTPPTRPTIRSSPRRRGAATASASSSRSTGARGMGLAAEASGSNGSNSRTIRPSTTCSTPTKGSAGADITFFEYPGTPRGRAGDGMVHRVVFRVASEEALDFWAERAGGERFGSTLLHDPEGSSSSSWSTTPAMSR